MPPPPRPYVVCIVHHPRPDLIGRRVRLLPGDHLLLGRGAQVLGPDALLDPRMSRRHARLLATEEGLRVEDLGSRNGTLVDGHPVQSALLRPGAVIGLGRLLLQTWRLPGDEAGRAVLGGASALPLVTESPAMLPVRDAIARAATDRASVLLVGEDGVGKATVARAIHRASRHDGPFVLLPIAALPDDDLDHALHGHAADPRPTGALARAEGGTLLLPRLDVASPALHAALLSFLEDCRLRPVGGQARPLSVRIVATSIRDPEAMARAGDLPRALLDHLGGHVIAVPPLRERREDILPIARHLATAHSGRVVALDRLLALLLVLHDWPGNVRELEGVVSRIAREQAEATTLHLPPWGAEVFGPRAGEVISTFDPQQLDPSRRSR